MDIYQKQLHPQQHSLYHINSELILIIDTEQRLEIENLMRTIAVTLDYNYVNCLITVD